MTRRTHRVVVHSTLLLGALVLAASPAPAIAQAGTSQAAPSARTTGGRHVTINGITLSDAELSAVERQYHVVIPDGAYWYDKLSGAWGRQGGPTAGLAPAGLALGGPLQPDASNGQTGVFINGRELHPLDVAALQQITPVYPGRYWVDAMGNVGLEGGPALANLWALAQAHARQTGAQSVYTRDGSMMTGTDGNGCYVFNDASSHTSWASNSC